KHKPRLKKHMPNRQNIFQPTIYPYQYYHVFILTHASTVKYSLFFRWNLSLEKHGYTPSNPDAPAIFISLLNATKNSESDTILVKILKINQKLGLVYPICMHKPKMH
ncbi:hypothetical protein ACJX0J_012534, partial [Zea mays]